MANHSDEQFNPQRRDFLRLLSGGAIVFGSGEVLTGCGGGSGTPKPPAGGPVSSASVTTTIPTTGGIANLANTASISFPSGAFPTAQAVTLKSTSDTETADKFSAITDLFQVAKRAAYEVRVNVGKDLPSASSYNTTLTVPDTFLSSLPSGAQTTVFVQFDQSGDGEGLDEFSFVDATFNATSKILTLSLPQDAFTNTRTTDGSYEAILTIAALPSAATKTVIRKGTHSRGLGPLTDGLNAPLSVPLVVVSPFGPRKQPANRPHRGVDLRAQTPISVIAAHDGTLIQGREVYKDGANKGQDKPTGYGLFAIVRHADGSSTLYAHLSSVDASGTVKKGQHIATSGATGGANPALGGGRGPHLHFEYVPGPYLKGSQVDPMPLVQQLSVLEPNTPPDMKVGDTLQLKANDAAGNSMAEDHTGVPIALEDLQWKSDTTSAATVDQTGFVKAISNGKATITATQTSTGKSASVAVTVTSATVKGTFGAKWTITPDTSTHTIGWSGLRSLTTDGIIFRKSSNGSTLYSGSICQDTEAPIFTLGSSPLSCVVRSLSKYTWAGVL